MKSPFGLPVVRRALGESPLVVIDVGAKGGVVAPWHQPGAGALVRTYGFEPFPADFAKLKTTDTTTYFQMAISDAPGRARFYGRSGGGSLIRRVDREWTGETFEHIDVEVETLENLARKGLIGRPDVIKTDVELNDLRAVRGAGALLDDVLAVTCEFEFYQTEYDNSFASIDTLLTKRGMLLFGLSLKNGSIGEVMGGDLLYVRDIGTLLNRDIPVAEKQAQVLKLFCIAAILRNPRYTAVIAAATKRVRLFSDAEQRQLDDFIDEMVYLPFAMPRGNRSLRGRIAHMLSLLTQLVAGPDAGVKSAPSPNMFTTYRRAYMNARWLPRSLHRRYRELQEFAVKYHRGFEGIYYARIPGDADAETAQPPAKNQ